MTLFRRMSRRVGFFTQKTVYKDKAGKGRVGRFQSGRTFIIGAISLGGMLIYKFGVFEVDKVVKIEDLLEDDN